LQPAILHPPIAARNARPFDLLALQVAIAADSEAAPPGYGKGLRNGRIFAYPDQDMWISTSGF
jgi:hypothetical protein